MRSHQQGTRVPCLDARVLPPSDVVQPRGAPATPRRRLVAWGRSPTCEVPPCVSRARRPPPRRRGSQPPAARSPSQLRHDTLCPDWGAGSVRTAPPSCGVGTPTSPGSHFLISGQRRSLALLSPSRPGGSDSRHSPRPQWIISSLKLASGSFGRKVRKLKPRGDSTASVVPRAIGRPPALRKGPEGLQVGTGERPVPRDTVSKRQRMLPDATKDPGPAGRPSGHVARGFRRREPSMAGGKAVEIPKSH